MSSRGIIAVLGATGVGKTRLAVEIARAVGGEIVNCDSMQVYEGLDIVTNKAPEEERQGVPHHILGCIPATAEFKVTEYRDKALDIIKRLQSQGKVPILCGGTCYYYEAVVYETLLDDRPTVVTNEVKCANAIKVDESEMESHTVLAKVDPAMAERLHPNERRKIRRALEVYVNSGSPYSEWLLAQNRQGGPRKLRFPNVLTLWLDFDLQALDTRLDTRVDDMLRLGAIKEMTDFCSRLPDSPNGVDFTHGVLQNIGFKELYPYLREICRREEGQPPQIDDNEMEQMRAEGVDAMKRATRRYVRKQQSWLRNRLGIPQLNSTEEKVSNDDIDAIAMNNTSVKAEPSPHLYVLDATDVAHWAQNVGERALHVVRAFISDTSTLPSPALYSTLSASLRGKLAELQTRNTKLQAITTDSTQGEWRQHECALCNKTLHGDLEWRIHLMSKSHKKRTSRKRVFDEYIEKQKNLEAMPEKKTQPDVA